MRSLESWCELEEEAGSDAASVLIKLGIIGGIGLYVAANSLYNVEGGLQAIVFNHLIGVQ
ncbi:prohibitin-1 mitochondrial-like, partial [Trifolium medium]|nr:prohibitin-1 mitochondrial-like [Trifolium medium]